MAYLPPLRTKLNVDFLPDIVSNISGGINNLIDNIVLREFQELQDNDTHSYFAILRTKQKIEFDVFGSGIKIILNLFFDYRYSYLNYDDANLNP